MILIAIITVALLAALFLIALLFAYGERDERRSGQVIDLTGRKPRPRP